MKNTGSVKSNDFDLKFYIFIQIFTKYVQRINFGTQRIQGTYWDTYVKYP